MKKVSRVLDVQRVEKELKIKLPAFFTEFHSQRKELIAELRSVSNDFDYITLSSDTDWMIQHNRDFLQLPREEGLCKNKICIGTDGCGNDSFISLIGNDQRVFFIDHDGAGDLIDEETDDFDWEHDELDKYESLEEYITSYIQIYKDLQ